MGLIEIEELLRPISPAEPAGPNLEYDQAFLELERTANGRVEQQIGDLITPAEPPDYRAVRRLATALLRRTKDLRVAVQLVRSLVHTDGYAALPEGLALVHGLLDQFWETVHPQLDAEDDNDPTMRLTALVGLCSPDVMLALRNAPLVRSQSFGPVDVEQLTAIGETAADQQQRQDYANVRAALQEAGVEATSHTVRTLQNASAQLFGIESLFETKKLSAPDFTALSQHLQRALRAMVQQLQAQPGTAELSAPAPSAGEVIRPPQHVPGEVKTRDDVIRVLESLCAYYARYEPSSPLPLLLERCKRLVRKSFMEILHDLAPAGVPQVELLAGKAAEE